MPSAVVTCGPAYAPIDSVRRITNLSSGALGATLADSLVSKGYDVTCFRGEMSTASPPHSGTVIPFGTNSSLLAALASLPAKPDVIFHAAALCDFELDEKQAPSGKIRSDLPALTLTLRPAPKVLSFLPSFFPQSLIVGWKYEVEGAPSDAIARGREQLARAGTTACVVNGPAYGSGFCFLYGQDATHFADKETLCLFLADWAMR